ncbi:FlgO family outer membrane protein [Desulfurivibrio dismutans]|uniref:FlgO family outer membrane protein n=1 Tax=Desulfurivibrio dismutans TaxID=1398908 RepID=UPI0023DBF360|nr:FlgO family outer membrane protein [Desulfurivibrio alkaliphilus]MDF1615186.1 FlgO family outer membrane protein [Desulfurivibrio alkaliphilus]
MQKMITKIGYGCWALFLAVLLLGLSACGFRSSEPEPRPVQTGATISVISPDFFGIGEELAGQLVGNYRHSGQPGRTKLILTSLVDLDNLDNSSRFGRTVSESLATQLFRHGFAVEEVRKADSLIFRDPGGELVLSRDVGRLARAHEAHAVVAGTYSLTRQTVIVNLRLLDATSHSVLSVAGMEIQRSPAIDHLLQEGTVMGRSRHEGLQDSGLSGYER